jgi:hypothetical protein
MFDFMARKAEEMDQIDPSIIIISIKFNSGNAIPLSKML